MYKKLDKIFKLLVGISFSVLVFYEISGIKKAIQRIVLFMEKEDIMLGITYSNVLTIIVLLRKISILCIFSYIIFIIISKIIIKVQDIYNSHHINTTDSFESSMLKYLNDKNEKKTYLVTGDWGSGKTYIVSRFFDKFFKYSSRKIYRISCFGLESREQVLKEIQNQIELNDTSMINLIQYIPLVGQPIYTFLKDSFTLNNINQNSIFIFDDFERITVIGLNEYQFEQDNYYINSAYYKKTPFLGRKIDSRELEKEFENIEKGMQKVKKIEEDRIYTETFQKYNVVTGLINELVDSYNLKVVIICNIDILGYKYLDLIFRGKLDCINYIKSVDISTFNSVFNDILNNQVFNKPEQKVIVGKFFNAICEDFENVVELYGRTNLRYVKTTIQAFIETITLYFEDDIDSSFEYLLSLFYSIFVSKSLYDEGNITHLSDFETGGNLCFYLDLYSHNRNTKLLDALSSSKFSFQIKWAGFPASSYWIMNMKPPRDLVTQLVNYSSYPYCKEEYSLFVDPNFKNDTSYLIEHILYMLFRIRNNEQARDAGSELQQNIISYLNTIDVNTILFGSEMLTSQEVVNAILDKMYRIKHVSSYQNVYRDIYDKLYEKTRIDAVPNNSQIHADYNRHVSSYYPVENE